MIGANAYPFAFGRYLTVQSFSERRGFALPEEVPDAYAEWGEPSQFIPDPLPDLSGGLSFKVIGEIAPLTETIVQRVHNPDDESQFVDVERHKKMTFKDTKSGQKLKLQFDTSRYDSA